MSSLRQLVLPEGAALEIVVVDNDSTDGSCQWAQRQGAVVRHLSRREFSWGRALNRGIAAARGDRVLLISSDVIAVDCSLLLQLCSTMAESGSAAVYARQMPRADAPAAERARLAESFGLRSYVVEGNTNIRQWKVVSNACALVRRDVWEAIPFDEAVPASEDRVWAHEIVRRGHRWAYCANAHVLHSHNDRVLRAAYRAWEFVKNTSGSERRPVTVWTVARACARILLNPFIHPLDASATWSDRLRAGARAPLEAAAFAVAAAAEGLGLSPARVRQFYW